AISWICRSRRLGVAPSIEPDTAVALGVMTMAVPPWHGRPARHHKRHRQSPQLSVLQPVPAAALPENCTQFNSVDHADACIRPLSGFVATTGSGSLDRSD